MSNSSESAHYFISIRLKRTLIEYAYVNVPITDDLIDPVEQGQGHINVVQMSHRAIQMGESPENIWYQEEKRVELHPIQKPPEPHERPKKF